MLESAKGEYEKQIALLADRLATVAGNEREMEELRKRYNYVEGAMYDMKISYQKNRQLNDGVDHLWGMK